MMQVTVLGADFIACNNSTCCDAKPVFYLCFFWK
uniref:Uncharacterized protein n=1 Tax=Rhizophora mucronata TaxID=61149 RepID=A0A2P2MX72_RHIMU